MIESIVGMSVLAFNEGLYRIRCGVNRLGDNSAFVNPADQLLFPAG